MKRLLTPELPTGNLAGWVGLTSLLVIAFLLSPVKQENNRLNASSGYPVDSSVSITICAVGDAMMHMPQINSGYIDSCSCYDFFDAFRLMPSLTTSCDLSIVNFETTLAGPPYSGYPQFTAPDTIAWNLLQAGFNFFINANNHSVDKGYQGINRTIEVFDRYRIDHTGTFSSTEEREKNYPVIKNINGFRIALLNYTYGTNGLLVPPPAVINTIDTALILSDMQEVSAAKPDAVIACMHWGNEYQRYPDSNQQEIARFLVGLGVDVIIGSHPHVIQPVDTISVVSGGKVKRGIVFWSLGNFYSNQRERYTDGGLFIRFSLKKNLFTGSLHIEDAAYEPVWVYKSDYPVKYLLVPASESKKVEIVSLLNQTQDELMNTFFSDTREQMSRNSFFLREVSIKTP